MSGTIWTVGHSNRSIGELLALLEAASITALADVRRFAGSRRQPQFQQQALSDALAQAGIAYRHVPSLGGRRHRQATLSPNLGWNVPAFRAYADYMGSAEFQAGLAELEALAYQQPTALMCAEAVPWRCHRRLIADALLVRGWRVFDILSRTRVDERRLTEFAVVDDGRITYPRPADASTTPPG